MSIRNVLHGFADHPARHILQNAFLMLPGMRRIQHHASTTGAMNDPALMTDWAKQVIQAAREAGLSVDGMQAAEVGPGHSLGVASVLLAAGASNVTAVDVREFADLRDTSSLEPSVDLAKQRGLTRSSTPRIDQLIKGIRYAIVKDNGGWPVENSSKDIVYSFYSGEHLRDPAAVLAETHRVLRPGGLCLYAIDLRDHFHFNGNWLQFLYYSDTLWEAMASRRGRWCNRIRSPRWRELFEQQFEILVFDELRREAFPDTFSTTRLAPEFSHYDIETLSVSHLWVVARRRST